MKNKIFTPVWKSFCLLLLAVFIGNTGWAQKMASWPLTANTTSIDAVIPANNGKTFSTTSTGTASFTSSIYQNTGWNVAGKSWNTAAISTVGYYAVTVAASMRSDATGPRDFQLQYSLNGSDWTSCR